MNRRLITGALVLGAIFIATLIALSGGQKQIAEPSDRDSCAIVLSELRMADSLLRVEYTELAQHSMKQDSLLEYQRMWIKQFSEEFPWIAKRIEEDLRPALTE